MTVIIVGFAATLAALVLYLGVERVGLAGLPLAALRAVAWGAVAALVINPACRRGLPAGTTVLLDHSLSMQDPGGGEGRWRQAVDSARAIAGGPGSGGGRGGAGRVILFGGSPSYLGESAPPPDEPRSLLGPAWREALSRGGPVAIVTDGEVDDLVALPSDLLARARVLVLPRPLRPDVGILSFELPRTLRAGDTAVAALELVVSRPGPAAAGLTLELAEAGRVLARQRLGATLLRADIRFVPSPAVAERELRRYTVRVSAASGDAEPRNDARVAYAEVVRAADVVMVSDRPDWDFRFAGAALGTSAGAPVRSFVRVEDAGWRESRSARPVSDLAVRRAIEAASLVVAHGTAANLETTRRLARRGLWLWPTEGLREGDWYVTLDGPASALGDALAGVPAESLPPLAALVDGAARAAPGRSGGGAAPASDSGVWASVSVRLGRRGAPRPAVSGWELDGRRVALVSGSGFYRWALKGGIAAQGFRALAVGLADWLIGSLASADSAEVVPLTRTVTRGERLRFVRGPGSRRVKREGRAVYQLSAVPPGPRAAVTLVFESPADTVEVALPPGTYRLPGSSGEVTVEEFSPEFLPRERGLGPQPGLATAGERESVPLRHTRWPYLAAVVALCMEWIVRRRRGLR